MGPQICFNMKVSCAVLAITGLSFVEVRRLTEHSDDILRMCFEYYCPDDAMTALPQRFDQYGYDLLGGFWCIQLMLLCK
jgi:hypothetical protein